MLSLPENSSIEKLDEYVRKNPNDANGYVELAKAHREAGNTVRAREVLDRLLKNAPTAGEALLLRAELLADSHDWIGAHRDRREASRAGVKAPAAFRLKVFFLQWLLLANQGWRPEELSRYMTLVICVVLSALLIYMSFGVLSDGGIIGFILVLALGVGFLWAGLAVGGVSLWLKLLYDRINPGWDIPVQRTKAKKDVK